VREAVVNQVLDAPMAAQLHAARYERTAERQGDRNGDTPRQLTTTRRPPPRARAPSRRRFLLERAVRALPAQRTGPSPHAHGEGRQRRLDTASVAAMTEEWCGRAFATPTVSDLCEGLDPLVEAWNDRDLSGTRSPFVVVDARVL
jgi:transposase-like protein